ncbi:hypothetical protein BKA62DRAFT_712764 [Auriculariales sp. MPI-PUGE-AT-0066]|nr:hypothetical protein BKA62DRAFT_712764 [Auriculariales sp. MPI-PUGE-AT-0066]
MPKRGRGGLDDEQEHVTAGTPPLIGNVPPIEGQATSQPTSATAARFTPVFNWSAADQAFGPAVTFTGLYRPVITRLFSSPPVYDEIFAHCVSVSPPTALARFARTCGPAREAVNDFLSRRWNRQLKRLFGGDPHEFRAMQARMGFLVARYQTIHKEVDEWRAKFVWTARGLDDIRVVLSIADKDKEELENWLGTKSYRWSGEAMDASRESLIMLCPDYHHYTSELSDRFRDEGLRCMQYKFVHEATRAGVWLLVSLRDSNGPAVSVLKPLLAAPQSLDIFSWRTCWTPYPRTKYEEPTTHPDFCENSRVAATAVARLLRSSRPSKVLREMVGERWLGDRSTWIVPLTIDGVENLLTNPSPEILDDKHWTLNGWTMEEGGVNKLLKRDEDDDISFTFPPAMWDVIYSPNKLQLDAGDLSKDTDRGVQKELCVPFNFRKSAESALGPDTTSDDEALIRAVQQLHIADRIYSGKVGVTPPSKIQIIRQGAGPQPQHAVRATQRASKRNNLKTLRRVQDTSSSHFSPGVLSNVTPEPESDARTPFLFNFS